ncbi:MAG TPA: TlpA family protein disulfide reductase, partial [Bacteroidetes bacterium]|nr:TlpA family protein disulfide reductase [Bacteroidota bacterium]
KYTLLVVALLSTIFMLALSFERDSNAIYVEKVDNFNKIEHIFNNDNDTTYLINFWATTCPPCLKELPLFEKLGKQYKKEKFKIYLINIDDDSRYESAVIPMVEKLKLKNKIYALIDSDYSTWTAKVNQEWYGALPYTVIYKKDKRKFFFGAFKNEDELEKEIKEFFR